MKAKRPHRVPLTEERFAELDRVEPLAEEPESRVLPGRGGRPLSDVALSVLVRGPRFDGLGEGEAPRWCDEPGRPIVVHGLHSTVRDGRRDRELPEHLGGLALARVDTDEVRAARVRSDMRDARRPILERWSRFCAGSDPLPAACRMTRDAGESSRRSPSRRHKGLIGSLRAR